MSWRSGRWCVRYNSDPHNLDRDRFLCLFDVLPAEFVSVSMTSRIVTSSVGLLFALLLVTSVAVFALQVDSLVFISTQKLHRIDLLPTTFGAPRSINLIPDNIFVLPIRIVTAASAVTVIAAALGFIDICLSLRRKNGQVRSC